MEDDFFDVVKYPEVTYKVETAMPMTQGSETRYIYKKQQQQQQQNTKSMLLLMKVATHSAKTTLSLVL